MLIKKPIRKRYDEWITDLDPGGSIRHLIVRVILGAIITVLVAGRIGQNGHYLIWGILGFFYNMNVMSYASRQNAPRALLFSSLILGVSLFLGATFHMGTPLFFILVPLLAFFGGICSAFGVIGKTIGKKGFVHFAVASAHTMTMHEQALMMTSYGTGVAAVAIVYFILVPMPKNRIIANAKKRFYRYLRKILEGEIDPNTQKARMVLIGIKENLLSRVPEQSEAVVQQLVKLRNAILMLVRYNNSNLVTHTFFTEISKEIGITTIALSNLLSAMEKDEHHEEHMMLFAYAKENLFAKIKPHNVHAHLSIVKKLHYSELTELG